MSEATPFGTDLIAAGYAFFRLVEIVGERAYPALDRMYDRRISRIQTAASEVQGALTNLQRHLKPQHIESLKALAKLTSYLHESFLSALHYRRPYSSANLHGIPIDVSALNEGNQALEIMTEATIKSGRLAAMGILVTHYFTLEYTVMLAHMEDFHDSDTTLMTPSADKEFSELMASIHTYENAQQAEVERLFEHIPAPSAAGYISGTPEVRAANEKFVKHVNTIVDVDLQRNDLAEHAQNCLFTETPNSALYFRSMYYTVFMSGLSLYHKTPAPTAVVDMYRWTEGKLTPIRKYGLCRDGANVSLDDRHHRDMISKRFKSFTPNKVYEYATLPSAGAASAHDLVIQKSTAGLIQVMPRVQVHVWRKELTWDRTQYDILAATVGEVGVMSDLLYMLPAIASASFKFRTSAEYPSAEIHSLYTRFSGSFDVTKESSVVDAAGNDRQDMIDDITHTRATLTAIMDPDVPSAVSIQPMPPGLRDWTTSISTVFNANASLIASNAVPKVCTNLNTNDILKLSNVDPAKQNVTYTEFKHGLIDIRMTELHNYEYINSMVLLHFGESLLHIDIPPCCAKHAVMGSNTMTLDRAQYASYHIITGFMHGAFNITYDSFKTMRTAIREAQTAFVKRYKKRTAGFLHPSCWLTRDDIAPGAAWTAFEASRDLVPGTILHFSPMIGAPPAADANHIALQDHITNFNP